MLEVVINISEGRNEQLIARIAATAGRAVLDVHSDPDHHRSVLTLVGADAARSVTTATVEHLDLRGHHGVHPRVGTVDVVPFVPLGDQTMVDALRARDAFAVWAGDQLGVPCFLYGPERSLPEVRRRAWHDLLPDRGPHVPHPRAGAICVGARPPLVAYNLWLAGTSLEEARDIARSLRGPAVRALAFPVAGTVQISMNLVAPGEVGPADVHDLVAGRARIARAELVGLVPRAVLDRTDPERWAALDLGPDRTIEARLRRQGWRVAW
jgi:glutamate formiminotransferase